MIRKEKHWNMDSLVLESGLLRVKVLANIGFKIASIVHKPSGKEFLFQPTLKEYKEPFYGDAFEKYDTSGLDEMLPTIDKCNYPGGGFEGRILPDHGDVWSLPWDVEIRDDKLIGRVRLKSLPLDFERTLSFEDEKTLRLDYRVRNLSNSEVKYLWALHGLNVLDDSVELVLEDDMKDIVNVHGDQDLKPFGLRYLKNYEDGKSYKFYFRDRHELGRVGLDYVGDRLRYIISYDSKLNPYLGVWINKGGFKGEYNVALEPSNGFYDTVEIANKNNKLAILGPNSVHKWTIFIEISSY